MSTDAEWRDSVRFLPPHGRGEKAEMLDFVNEHFVPLEPLNVAVDLCKPGYR